MYGKIFDSMYDSTLAEDWRALVTFQQMIVLCDADGMIDMTPQALSRRTGIPIEHLEAGITILEDPDPYSRTPDQDGKRIELIDEHRPWGWHIVNHEKYKNLVDADTIRAQTKERVRRHREKKRCNGSVTQGNASKRHKDTDINKIKSKPSSSKNKFSTEDMEIAVMMDKKITEIIPNRKSVNLDTWANEIRLMRQMDNRTVSEIIEVFNWANNDIFWKTNILSASKLRKQFDVLTAKKTNGGSNGAHQQNNQSRAGRVSAKIREVGEKDIAENGFTPTLD